MGNFSLRVTPAGVNPNLLRWVETAAQASPYDVVVTSGKRLGDPKFHGQGSAIDVKLYDTQTGQEIPNYQDARSFNTYQGFANLVRGAQMQLNPELGNQLRWGGYFSGGKGQYGSLDLMHFDIGGDTVGMAGGGWDTGLTPEQAKIWGLTAGTGGYGGGGASPTGDVGGLAGAFQDAIAPPEKSPWAKTLGSIGSTSNGDRKAASQGRAPEPPPVPVIQAEPAPTVSAPAPDVQAAPEAAVSGLADLFKVGEIGNRIGQAARLPRREAVLMDIRQGIVEAANALGISPHDLATVISYETGGTFNPTQQGPVTKWGTHRGFLQFGEPQAARYGINWNDPINTQLGGNGAVVRYLRDTGVRPGMGLLDLYSAVNAGGVGRYSARDQAAGGTPGNVAQKVSSMGAHQAKASALFGGEFQPSMTSLAGAFGEPPPPPPTFQSSLADEFSPRRYQAGGSGARRVTPPGATVSRAGPEQPVLDFAAATPEPARTAEPPAVARPTGGVPSGGLAELFQVGDIGLASSRAVDPRTGQPLLTRSRRSYG